ncbi:MAG: hypothetical protein QM755_19505 [Luteolibacter sp.]
MFYISPENRALRIIKKCRGVVPTIDPECLGQLAGPGTKVGILDPGSPGPHGLHALQRLKRPEQDEAVHLPSSGQNIEEPVDSIVEIYICITRLMGGDEAAGSRAEKRVAGGVSLRRISLRFHDPADASIPVERTADKVPGTIDRVSGEKIHIDPLHLQRPVG